MKRATVGSGTVKTWFRTGARRLLAAVLLLALAAPVRAAGPDEELIKKADEAMGRADYATAINALTELTTKHTASLHLNRAKYSLGSAYFLKGEPDNAIKVLQPMADPRFPQAEIREAASLLLGQAYTRAGETAKQKGDSKGAEQNLDSAIKTYSDFLGVTGFPRSDNRPDAVYGRAVAELYRGLHDAAIADVDYFQKTWANNPLIVESQFLRATIVGSKAAAMIQAGQKDEGDKLRGQAHHLFQQLLSSRLDVAVANQAAFSAAELWFEAKRYEDSVFYYRQVLPKEDIVTAQQFKVGQMDEAYRKLAASPAVLQAGGANNAPVARRAYERLQQERGKLEQFKSGPNFFVAAALRVAVCYMAQEKWDEAQIIGRHLLRNLEGDAYKVERKSALDIMFRVQIGRQDPDAGLKYYNDFQAEFPKDVVAQDFGLYLAKVYWMKKRHDEALKMIDRMASEYPTGTSTEEAVVTKSSIYLERGDSQSALKHIEIYLKQYPPGKGKFVPETEYRKAQVNQAIGSLDAALKGFREVRAKYGSESFIEDANLQVGTTLVTLGNNSTGTNAVGCFKEAIAELDQFQQRFATSASLPSALLSLGDANVGLLKINVATGNTNAAAENLQAAVTVNKDILKRWPEDKENGPQAQYRIGIAYFWAKQYDKMAVAFDDLARKFKDSPLQADAHFWMGYNHSLQKNYAKAAEEFEIVVRNFPKSQVAPDACLRIGQSWITAAMTIGRSPAMLPPDRRKQWDELIEKAMVAFEKTMADYPQNPAAQTAVQEILNVLTIKLRNKLIAAAGVDAYFKKLLEGSAGQDPALKVNALFALGNLQYASGESKLALGTFDRAVQSGATVELPPQCYEAYGKALQDNARYDDAIKQFQKMVEVAKRTEEWPAWADGVYRVGEACFRKRDFLGARRQFEQFSALADNIRGGKKKADSLTIEERALYNSKSLPDAELGMANILFEEKKYDEAIKRFEEYIGKTRGATRARARAVIGLGMCLLYRGQGQSDFESAERNFSKAADFYTAFDDVVVEAVFMAGQALEKLGRPDDARKNYDDIVKRFPSDPYAAKAKDALAKLPPPQPKQPGK
ncbi:MAG: tetratricopeptide repeat protein [Verrucomicrobia bacterium]|nr:tetratricopeptide repeat protein [Verrucomicrobiota bacterium]